MLALVGLIGAIVPAAAQIGSERYASIVVDADRGTVLVAASPDEARYPASLTKMMTLYLAFEALRDRRLTLSTPIFVSSDAASMPPSRLGLLPGGTLTAEEAILALITKSANDAAAALGEHLGGGSEPRFAQMMTLRARSLGMTRTTFRNASGLPDLDQMSTARDMATLGRRLVQDFPDRYAMFATPHFVFRGRTHWNHNRMLGEYDGADGIKTGYINDSGFNLVASAKRDGVRLVAAVFGGRSGRERDRHMVAVLDQGFAQLGIAPRERPVAEPAPVPGRGWRGLGVLADARAAGRIRPAQSRGGRDRPVLLAARPVPDRHGGRDLARTQVARADLSRGATRVAAPARGRNARLEQGDGGRTRALTLPTRSAAASPPPRRVASARR